MERMGRVTNVGTPRTVRSACTAFCAIRPTSGVGRGSGDRCESRATHPAFLGRGGKKRCGVAFGRPGDLAGWRSTAVSPVATR
jgi:hypothetical protein